jgi:hypothetical protein
LSSVLSSILDADAKPSGVDGSRQNRHGYPDLRNQLPVYRQPVDVRSQPACGCNDALAGLQLRTLSGAGEPWHQTPDKKTAGSASEGNMDVSFRSLHPAYANANFGPFVDS